MAWPVSKGNLLYETVYIGPNAMFSCFDVENSILAFVFPYQQSSQLDFEIYNKNGFHAEAAQIIECVPILPINIHTQKGFYAIINQSLVGNTAYIPQRDKHFKTADFST